MKKTLIILVMAIIGQSALGQLQKVETTEVEKSVEIGKIAPMGAFVISLEKSGDTYIFTFKDVKYMHIDDYKSFQFKETGGDLDMLYNEIQTGIATLPEKHTTIKLPSGWLFLKYDKSFGVGYVQMGYAIDENADYIAFSRSLTKKDINKLFGRK